MRRCGKPLPGHLESLWSEKKLTMSQVSDQRQQRLNKLESLQAQGRDPFAHHRYQRSHIAAQIEAEFGSLEGESVAVCGRVVAVRTHGKSIFADLQDASGTIQLYARLDVLGEEKFQQFSQLDLGDIIGVSGEVFRTRTGEMSVRVEDFALLAKALRPLPEKFHGLQDTELRYRQRYLDLLVNAEVQQIFRQRTLIIQAARGHLTERGFLEVTTPVLQPLYGGAAARPFTTYHNALDMKLYMRIAPELYLKRLIVGGLERVFEIGPVFRNEGIDTRHNPEFTILEVYQAYADYEDMMALTEELVGAMCQAVHGKLQFTYQGHHIDLTPPWPRRPLLDLIAEHTGVDFPCTGRAEEAREAATDLDLGDTSEATREQIIDKAFARYVQPHLIQPMFVTDYPVEMSPLAKRKPDEPHLTARFEPFIAGEEVGNAFSELNDPLDQRVRFEEQIRAREAGALETHPLDEDFLLALEHGMPPTGGLGLGLDRLVMLLTDQPNLREVMLFPLLRRATEDCRST